MEAIDDAVESEIAEAEAVAVEMPLVARLVGLPLPWMLLSIGTVFFGVLANSLMLLELSLLVVMVFLLETPVALIPVPNHLQPLMAL